MIRLKKAERLEVSFFPAWGLIVTTHAEKSKQKPNNNSPLCKRRFRASVSQKSLLLFSIGEKPDEAILF